MVAEEYLGSAGGGLVRNGMVRGREVLPEVVLGDEGVGV